MTGGGEGPSGQYASPGLMLPGISSSMAGPEAGTAFSGEKTLRSVTQSVASTDTDADISKTTCRCCHPHLKHEKFSRWK